MGRIHGGSSGTKAWLWILSWYTCSLVTLFMNKIILNKPKSSPQLLGVFQMLSTAILGGVKVLLARRRRDGARVASETPPLRDIAMLGSLRAATVLLGLFAISHVAVSFVEAVKSSAPLFTAVFAWIILRDRISFRVGVTLLPCVVGLAIASATELSFDAIGFSAAAACNVLDCIQNVLSKRVLRVTNPVHLQFYTSVAAALIQVPFTMYMLGSAGGGAESGTETAGVASWLPSFLLAPGLRFSWSNFALPSRELTSWLLLASVSYHLQSVCAYCTMNTVTPLTMSVANTVKRGILIVLSIIYFGNDVGALTYAGMILIMGGAFAYGYTNNAETAALNKTKATTLVFEVEAKAWVPNEKELGRLPERNGFGFNNTNTLGSDIGLSAEIDALTHDSELIEWHVSPSPSPVRVRR